jgi:hypothetical protein
MAAGAGSEPATRRRPGSACHPAGCSAREPIESDAESERRWAGPGRTAPRPPGERTRLPWKRSNATIRSQRQRRRSDRKSAACFSRVPKTRHRKTSGNRPWARRACGRAHRQRPKRRVRDGRRSAMPRRCWCSRRSEQPCLERLHGNRGSRTGKRQHTRIHNTRRQREQPRRARQPDDLAPAATMKAVGVHVAGTDRFSIFRHAAAVLRKIKSTARTRATARVASPARPGATRRSGHPQGRRCARCTRVAFMASNCLRLPFKFLNIGLEPRSWPAGSGVCGPAAA